MTEQAVLDPSALDQIIEDTGGDTEFILEIIDEFLGNTRELIEGIESACVAGDAAAARMAAHSIKGTSASFGARALSALALDIESRCRDGDLAGAAERIPQLRGAFEQADEALRERISQLENDA